MKKLYRIVVALMLVSSQLQAQTVTSKSFNEIKRSKQYFYYDMTMEKEEEAKNAANINLAKLINDYCVENSITNVKVKDTDLKNVQYLKMDKNGMVRILAYVEKALYIGKEEKSKDQTVIVSKVEEVKLPSQNIPSVEAASLVNNEAACSLVKWQQDVLEELLHISSAEKLMMKLSELQTQYKVKRFGLLSDCKNEKDSFWVFYDSGKNVVAILGPGSGERYNFNKGINDSLDTYRSKGMNAIWFQLSK